MADVQRFPAEVRGPPFFNGASPHFNYRKWPEGTRASPHFDEKKLQDFHSRARPPKQVRIAGAAGPGSGAGTRTFIRPSQPHEDSVGTERLHEPTLQRECEEREVPKPTGPKDRVPEMPLAHHMLPHTRPSPLPRGCALPWPSKLAEAPIEDDLPLWVTTLTVRNIPPRSTPDDLLQTWPCTGNYDFLYLPFTAKRRRASGYAFVNFVSNAEAQVFYRQWNGVFFQRGGAGRQLSITTSSVQGFQENIRHCSQIESSMVNEKYAPLIFGREGSKANPMWVLSTLRYLASSCPSAEDDEEDLLRTYAL